MRSKFITLLLAGLAIGTARGQVTLKGRVSEGHGRPVAYASVSVKNSLDGARPTPRVTFLSKPRGREYWKSLRLALSPWNIS
jgi:hypothetical protein